ncbi:MAG TPA: NTP transferase domain-containing protein, partial [Acidimicrobiales bacterium]
ALAFGLRQVSAGQALVLAADHPWLERVLLQLLLDRLDAGDADAVVPRDPSGQAQPLLAAYRTSVATEAAHLVESGQRSMHALLDLIEVEWLDERVWRTVDRAARSFQDIDEPHDLTSLADEPGA